MKNRQNTAGRSRSIYNAAKKMATAKGLIASPGYLRMEAALSNTKNKYNFFIKNVQNEVPTELKLDRNDLFVVDKIGLFLIRQVATTIGKEVIQSYPNIIVFAPVAGLVTSDLEAIYNGYFTLKVGTKVNIENLSNQNFRYVPDTQQAAADTKSSFNVDDATYQPAAVLDLHGTMDIQMWTEFPMGTAGLSLTPTDPANGVVKLCLILYGFLIKGGADQK